MDRMQIALKLAMDVLGVPICVDNYHKVCGAVYEAEQRGVYVSPSRVLFDEKTGRAYSPMSHESGGNLSWNLRCDVEEIEGELAAGIDDSVGWSLDSNSLRVLEMMKNERVES